MCANWARCLRASLVIGVALPLVISGVFKWQIALGTVARAVDRRHACSRICGSRRADGSRVCERLTAGYLGMTIAHIGFAVTLIGIVVTSHLSIERDVRLANGASTQLGALTFTLVAVDRVQRAELPRRSRQRARRRRRCFVCDVPREAPLPRQAAT